MVNISNFGHKFAPMEKSPKAIFLHDSAWGGSSCSANEGNRKKRWGIGRKKWGQ